MYGFLGVGSGYLILKDGAGVPKTTKLRAWIPQLGTVSKALLGRIYEFVGFVTTSRSTRG